MTGNFCSRECRRRYAEDRAAGLTPPKSKARGVCHYCASDVPKTRAAPAKPGRGAGPFFQGDPGRCPLCGLPTEVVGTGFGGWTEVRECEAGHEFCVSFEHSNDPGTVTSPPEAVEAAYGAVGPPKWRRPRDEEG